MKVEFKGGQKLEAALKELDISQARKKGIARRALDKAAVPIRDDWVRGVDVESGDLKRSIKIGSRKGTRASRKFGRGAGQDIVERFIGIDEREGPDGRLGIYAELEEFGHDSNAPNPAGRNAYETRKMESFNMIGDLMWQEIRKVAK